ncbi:MAG: type II secretion system secretin GspD [Alphaproteobacteria bacterium]|nr:type II secretion system secretin GspD [Alphaproteobacteria bacterium]
MFSVTGSTSYIRQVVSVLMCVGLLGCSTPGDDVAFDETIKVSALEADINRPSAKEITAPQIREEKEVRNRAEYIDGNNVLSKPPAPIQLVRRQTNGDLSLTFKNTDIRVVIRAILGDTLNVPYVLDPRVTGNVTLETSGPISKEALRLTLEALLRTKGYALVETTEGHVVLPLAEAPLATKNIGQGIPASTNLPSFGVQIVPLNYTLPTEMEKLIEPFSSQGGILRADDPRRILILAGTSQELASMIRAVQTFDVDRMAGMSFAIYALNYAEPEQIVKELKEIFGEDGSDAGTNVSFIPVPRINKIIAVANNKKVLRAIEQWIDKLDLGESSPGRRIYVYQVKNGRAADISDTLNLILGARYGNYGSERRSVSRGEAGLLGAATGGARTNQSRGNGYGVGRNNLNQFNGLGDEGVRIVPSEESNSIVIMATPAEFAVIETALKQIDIPPRQVLVEVTLAQVSLNDELRYGLQWHFDSGNNSVSFGQSTSPAAQFPGFSWVHTSSSSISAALNAIESMTDVKVISSPKLLVLNNQSATLQVGDEVPVPTASSVSSTDSNAPIVNSIQYRNTGVILTVTPRINDGGLIMLDIEQEMSEVVETASSGIDAPTIQQRKMSSSVAVQNGSTIALGGLIRSSASKVHSGVPLLKSIPLLGNVFRSTDLVERRTELVVLLTPRIIRDQEETQNVMDYLKREFRTLLGGDDPVSAAIDRQ